MDAYSHLHGSISQMSATLNVLIPLNFLSPSKQKKQILFNLDHTPNPTVMISNFGVSAFCVRSNEWNGSEGKRRHVGKRFFAGLSIGNLTYPRLDPDTVTRTHERDQNQAK
ncbi:hypothetical protein An08g02540 [Aspergillus niger]|uniref:Uncharacterized protein n=2 Tax=Aspergillus niger TaxID=5061 RepID=A2QQH4_ASPNC|nr:hypothetical protein An08g02540 [Aspergillus niger]CAK45290.1 hypothetical protein An08g02540 [Aspergillus niger]